MTAPVSISDWPSPQPYFRPPSETLVCEKVLVVLDGSKQITKYALEWALSNVLVRPGESITLLALHAPGSSGPVRRIWGFPMSLQILGGECASHRVLRGVIDNSRGTKEVDDEIVEGCTAMIQHFQAVCNQKKIAIDVKVQEVDGREASAAEAKRIGATWVVLDKHLKKEAKMCMELLQCNIVIVKPSEPKILRLNLKRNSRILETPNLQSAQHSAPTVQEVLRVVDSPNVQDHLPSGPSIARNGPHPRLKSSTPSSSPDDVMTPFTPSDLGTSSKLSSDTSPSQVSGPLSNNRSSTELVLRGSILEATSPGVLEKGASFRAFYPDIGDGMIVSGMLSMESSPKSILRNFDQGNTRASSDYSKPSSGSQSDVQLRDGISLTKPGSRHGFRNGSRANSRKGSPVKTPMAGSPAKSGNPAKRESFEGRGSSVKRENTLGQSLRAILQENADQECTAFDGGSPSGYHGDQEPCDTTPESRLKRGKADALMRQKMAMMLNKHNLPGPPPLCSMCQHKAPMFGKPPQRYTYKELEVATNGFSRTNFLAEGGYGSVHRGTLPDGQGIAVKQYKLASTQGDKEFCAEVEVLSYAQHRNVVMLIGYCIEGKRRLLVYEFICNGSLDGHLYERDRPVLEWNSRHKIAVGTARGLRYLHEDCRVGCIVHRDLRPNNILLTHDFEPMVGDFGLARWQPDGHCGVETRVIGTFGYLAPEYTQHGQITDKADVYSFGVVLLELITGRKAIDINRPKGEQCLTEWARPLLGERGSLPIDPRLENRYSDIEVESMLHASSCCIRKDPSVRPRMAQVLRMLEGEMIFDAHSSSTSGYFAGRLSMNHMSYYPLVAPAPREEVKYPNFVSPQSEYNSKYSSPNRKNGNLPYGPMISSPKMRHISATKESVKKVPLVASYIGQDGQKLSYEALKAAYMDKVSSHHVTASAYESYQIAKDY
ncbi:inactive protein kinase SELMODRAFT_444075 isoform X1 [Physcomitrium patens]|uniref:Protein kinase domain-containing protein n=1 Tax=Physcomitrium patens TaxID=3218 RepID=A0A2K1L942_PHYPA|nr:proline-rich receptor-like protein kinase PERK5 isoform X1 [Physcomitrium patens]PNR62559.1 hypothetical protein PHYPA_000983 [Physcomitrium patens]|eukprot:XP_024391656.1 proline-rich receptor-like protein kinase PERK5 isoform X1 [Physcomitrella patens]